MSYHEPNWDARLLIYCTIAVVAVFLFVTCTGCTTALNTPDELSLHGFFGQGEADSTSFFAPWRGQTGHGSMSSDNEFWMLGGTVTWYLEELQPRGPMHRKPNTHPIGEK